jgi:hypothetical protein
VGDDVDDDVGDDVDDDVGDEVDDDVDSDVDEVDDDTVDDLVTLDIFCLSSDPTHWSHVKKTSGSS